MATKPKKISESAAKEMLGEIEELYSDAQDAMMERRDEILENVAFYGDIQHAVKNGEFVPDVDAGEGMEISNILSPIVRAAVAATLKQPLNVTIPAVHGDQKSRAKAEASEQLCQAFQKNGVINFDEHYNTVLWSKIAGLGWLKVYWDPDEGRVVEQTTGFETLDDEEEIDAFGTAAPIQLAEGEICTEFVSSIDGLVDPTISSVSGLKKPGAYFIHRKLRPMRECSDRFEVDFFGKPTKGRWSAGKPSPEQVAFADIVGSFDGKLQGANTLCEIVEFWQMPTRKFPNGRLVIFSGSLILFMGPNILRPCRLPFIPLKGDNPMPGTLHSRGVIGSLKQNQRSYNRTKTKIREIVDKVVNSRVWVPIGSGVDPDTFGDIPGQVVEYTKGFRPETEQPPEVPGSLFTYVATLSEEAKYSSGYGDVAQGLDSPNISTGRHYAFAKEAASSVREPDMQTYRVFLATVLQHCLYTARQFYDEGRTLRILGQDGRWVLKEFWSDQFDMDNDIVIETFSDIPDSKAQRFSETVELFTAGLLDPQNEAAKNALKILNHPYYRSSTFDADEPHRDRAKRQILQIMQEPWVDLAVNPFDNHTIWLEEIDRWRATTEYDELDEIQKQKINAAAELHEAYLGMQNQVYGQDMAAIQGGGAPQLGPGPQEPVPPGAESPLDGGHSLEPAPAPTMSQYVEDPGSDAGGNALVQSAPSQ